MPQKRRRKGKEVRTSKNGRERPKAPAATLEVSPEPSDAVFEPDDGSSGRGGGPPDFFIVGVGASAGGLEAVSQLLHALPAEPGFAIVMIQHLDPRHESALPSLLSAHTQLQVVQAADGLLVEPNHVYVIPPNVQMGMTNGSLHLMPRPSDRSQYTPIDYFLRSLAESVQERAIAVILSGTASDGTVGVRDVKAAGGIVIVQDPDTAKYDGMPRAAISSGTTDLVLNPPQIAAELVRISQHPLARARREPDAEPLGLADNHLDRVFMLLRAATSVDFRRYKQATIQRRLQRRIVLHRLPGMEQYLKYLQENPGEVHALYQDILIHVTRFFRDAESFEVLKGQIFPRLFEQRRGEQTIRIWVPGCSTGEEAYSVGIALLEYLGDRGGTVGIQIFATDISEPAIDYARNGNYPEGIAADVFEERLRRFFAKADRGYRVNKVVRDLCIFARHDLTRDPPFSKLDLIMCRNVLIYMGVDLQKRLMQTFHYALRPSGFLMLGHAETVGLHSDLFGIAEKKHRIYERKAASVPAMHFPVESAVQGVGHQPRPHVAGRDDGKNVQNEANRLIQERFAPAGVIVDADFHVVQFRGQTGSYLEPPPGDPSLDLLKMAREGLLHGLKSALQDARKSGKPVRRDGLHVRANGGWRDLCLEILPMRTAERSHFLVLFIEDAGKAKPGKAIARLPQRGEPQRPRGDDRVTRLEQELASSREYLQSIIQELEAANEELQSANEEVLSANEELQSTNEELDTAKEELQSTNEELNTVNEELQVRNDELSRVNSDLLNLLGSVQIAIVIVGSDLCIRRFTPMAERVLNLQATDVGRPIGHIKPNIDCPNLEELIGEVIETVNPHEREARDRDGRWYSLRIRPYKNIENRIDGAVLSLFDVDQSKRQEQELRRARDYAEALVQTINQPMLVVDDTLRVQRVNRAFCDQFRLLPAEIERQPLQDDGDGKWTVPGLRRLLEQVLKGDSGVEQLVVEHAFPNLGRRKMMMTARRLDTATGGEPLILIGIDDHTGRG